MKKLIISVLIAVLLITAVFGMVGCEKNIWHDSVEGEIVEVKMSDASNNGGGYWVKIKAEFPGGQPSDKIYSINNVVDERFSKNYVSINYPINLFRDQNIEKNLKIENGIYEAQVLISSAYKYDEISISTCFFLEEDEKYISKAYDKFNSLETHSEEIIGNFSTKKLMAAIKLSWTFKISDYI